ncbi:hypothetical protein CLV30_12812 [Haloactinopolyspora alba]|uniref:Uncharacterized protein n=1 Tax=Haloactinopolyspora alba TaxID=648780 RepID=A0A2P8DEX5_9ACTN|nr:hypothetical protein [Haloactinopolyspora alba]PSK95760.1 hypothetical protein CLV30_12812 [Haloactinopolyspora alba]
MSTEVAVALVGLVGVLITASSSVLVAALNRTRGVANDAATAAKAAVAARDYAQPTGNGYAEDTVATLGRIEQAQTEMGKDIGGLRSELRTDRRTNADAFAELRQADRDLHQRITQIHPPTRE